MARSELLHPSTQGSFDSNEVINQTAFPRTFVHSNYIYKVFDFIILARYDFHLFGSEFRNKSFVFPFSFSGKVISKDINMSPFLEASLDNGRPFPAIRLTVVGFTISSNKLTTNRSPLSVGTSTLVPHNAWKMIKRVYQIKVYLKNWKS